MAKTTTNRYGETRKITNNGHGWYTIEGKSHYYRAGMNDDNTEIAYVDFEGGPFISVGSDFDGRGKVLSLEIDKSAPKDHFKVRVEVDQ